jgi:hypothetical protein
MSNRHVELQDFKLHGHSWQCNVPCKLGNVCIGHQLTLLVGHDHAGAVSAKLKCTSAAILVKHALLIHTNIQTIQHVS